MEPSGLPLLSFPHSTWLVDLSLDLPSSCAPMDFWISPSLTHPPPPSSSLSFIPFLASNAYSTSEHRFTNNDLSLESQAETKGTRDIESVYRWLGARLSYTSSEAQEQAMFTSITAYHASAHWHFNTSRPRHTPITTIIMNGQIK